MYECENCGSEMRLIEVTIDSWGYGRNDTDTDTNFYITYIKNFVCPYCGDSMDIEGSAVEE